MVGVILAGLGTAECRYCLDALFCSDSVRYHSYIAW